MSDDEHAPLTLPSLRWARAERAQAQSLPPRATVRLSDRAGYEVGRGANAVE
jgi:hypothetical protein